MPKVEVFFGVVITNADGTEERYSQEGALTEGAAPSKITAALGMRVLKQILDQIREKQR